MESCMRINYCFENVIQLCVNFFNFSLLSTSSSVFLLESLKEPVVLILLLLEEGCDLSSNFLSSNWFFNFYISSVIFFISSFDTNVSSFLEKTCSNT